MKYRALARSIAAVVKHRVTLAESQILKPVVELVLFVNQARGRACRAACEEGGGKHYGKNERCKFHGIFLSSSGLKQMKNKVKAQRRIDYGHEG
jgi:hypothetical protein